MPSYPWQQLPFQEAIDYFATKQNIDTNSWRDLQGLDYDVAFAVAGAKGALLQDMRDAVEKAITEGTTLQEFRKDFDRIVQTRGWSYQGDRDWRTNTIYNTNLRTAYAGGRWEQIQQTKAKRPYLQWRHGGSGDPRPLHIALDRKVFSLDDPFWQTMGNPPIGHNCFPPGTLVATSQGWAKIETIRRGDLVVGGSGDIKPCIGTHTSLFNGELVEIRVNDRSFQATPNHRFLTLRGWVEAGLLEVDDVIVQVPQVSILDKFVTDVNQEYSSFTDNSMSLPVNTSRLSNTLYADLSPFNSDVNPVRRTKEVEFTIPSERMESLYHSLLIEGWFSFGVGVSPWLSSKGLNSGRFNFTCNSWGKKRTALFQLLRYASSAFMCLFSFSKMRMIDALLVRRHFPHVFSTDFFTIRIPNMLKGNSFTSRNAEVEVLEQPHNCSGIHTPTIAELPNREVLNLIEVPESLFSGQPLSQFNSLDGFRTWATSHCVLNKIEFIGQTYYSGNVHNISVLADESYCLPAGIVHNCRCSVFALNDRDLERLKLKVEDAPKLGSEYGGIPVEPDPGWGGGHGRSNPEQRRKLLVSITQRLQSALAVAVEQEARFASLRFSQEFGAVEKAQMQAIRDRVASGAASPDLPRADGLYSVIEEIGTARPKLFRGVVDGLGDLQAMAIVTKADDAAVLNHVVSAPWNLRGMPATGQQLSGAGSRLIAEVAKESVELGYEGRVRLSPSPEVVGFYQKLGFISEGDRMVLRPDAAKKLMERFP
jgi:hypothetical protein